MVSAGVDPRSHFVLCSLILIYIVCNWCTVVPTLRSVKIFPNKPCLLHVCNSSLLKTAIKVSLGAISPFFHYVFTRLENFLFLSSLKLSSANFLSLEEFKICCLGKGYVCGDGISIVYSSWHFKL